MKSAIPFLTLWILGLALAGCEYNPVVGTEKPVSEGTSIAGPATEPAEKSELVPPKAGPATEPAKKSELVPPKNAPTSESTVTPEAALEAQKPGPTVLFTLPQDGQTMHSSNMGFLVAFNKPIDVEALKGSLSESAVLEGGGKKVPIIGVKLLQELKEEGEGVGDLPVDPKAAVVFLLFPKSTVANTTYQATVSKVKDLEGNEMTSAHSWSFIMKGTPELVENIKLVEKMPPSPEPEKEKVLLSSNHLYLLKSIMAMGPKTVALSDPKWIDMYHGHSGVTTEECPVNCGSKPVIGFETAESLTYFGLPGAIQLRCGNLTTTGIQATNEQTKVCGADNYSENGIDSGLPQKNHYRSLDAPKGFAAIGVGGYIYTSSLTCVSLVLAPIDVSKPPSPDHPIVKKEEQVTSECLGGYPKFQLSPFAPTLCDDGYILTALNFDKTKYHLAVLTGIKCEKITLGF